MFFLRTNIVREKEIRDFFINMAGVLRDETCGANHPVMILEMTHFKLAEFPLFKRSTECAMINGWCLKNQI